MNRIDGKEERRKRRKAGRKTERIERDKEVEDTANLSGLD